MSLSSILSERPGTPDATPQPATILRELAAILESAPFRNSRQCQRLLRYIVEQSLDGHTAALRERVIGMAVFDRRADYDPGQDPVVRIRAADVRKRLAQYYQSAADLAVQIDVPPGSYRASFRIHASAELSLVGQPLPSMQPPVPHAIDGPAATAMLTSPPAPRPLRRLVLTAGVATLVVALAVVAAVWQRSGRPGPALWFDQFWAPFLRAPQPVLVCLGTNAVYHLSDSYMAAYRGEHHIADNGAELFADLPPQSQVRAADLLPVPGTFVGFADVAAATNVVTLLVQHQKPFAQRLSSDLSFPDLRNVPSVLVGGFNNRWTLEMTGDLPFRFANGHSVIDTQTGHVWSQVLDHASTAVDDYALISRLTDAKTGAPLLVIAGIGTSGTQAAGEFVSSRAALARLAHGAPQGWAQRNMQVLLHVRVVEYAPSKPEVVAERFW
jgi:hypothetical protein